MLLSLLAAAFAAAASPLPPEVLDTITLGARPQLYSVSVPSCATFGRRLIRIKLHGVSGTSRVLNAQLVYADRSGEMIPLRLTLQPGQMSRWVDLDVHGHRDNRCVSYIALEANALASAQTARLEIWGLSENTPVP